MRRPEAVGFLNQASFIWLGAALLLGIVLTVADQRQFLVWPRDLASKFFTPIQQGLAGGTRHLVRTISHLGDAGQLRAEKEELQKALSELRLELITVRAAALETHELREQLHYVENHRQFTFLPAEVLARDTSNLLGHLVVDRGRHAGIQPGMVVMAPAGLVGRVVAVSEKRASILPITQSASAVNAKIQGIEAATGIANGTASGRLVLRFLPQHESVDVGDTVVTSGLGGTFPRDLPIGQVTFVRSRDVEMFQEAEVEPLVAMHQLGRLLIITNFHPLGP